MNFLDIDIVPKEFPLKKHVLWETYVVHTVRRVIPYLLCNHWKFYPPEQELEDRVESRRMHRTPRRKEKVRTKGDPN